MPTTAALAIPYPAPSATPDVPYDMQQLAEKVEALLAGAYTAYTPTWTAVTTNPTIGNGLLSGRWRKPGGTGSKTVRAEGILTVGSTSTLGSGVYSFALPTATAAVYRADQALGVARYRTAAGTYVCGYVCWQTTTTVGLYIPTPGGATPNLARWAHNAPAGLISADQFDWSITYEGA